MSKKSVTIIVVLIVLTAAIAFVVYEYMTAGTAKSLQNGNQANQALEIPAELKNEKPISQKNATVQVGGIKAQGSSGQGTLIICSDTCGDGVCSNAVPVCKEGDFNCICAESHESCPVDCK